MADSEQGKQKVRVDKWLWAARFFKTRSLAKAAIEGGKVQLQGQRVKVSKEVAVGDQLVIRQGWDEK
ncbi:MAG: RNA-binding S4 domain-containing protein, partial [Luminiphilus sp.]